MRGSWEPVAVGWGGAASRVSSPGGLYKGALEAGVHAEWAWNAAGEQKRYHWLNCTTNPIREERLESSPPDLRTWPYLYVGSWHM